MCCAFIYWPSRAMVQNTCPIPLIRHYWFWRQQTGLSIWSYCDRDHVMLFIQNSLTCKMQYKLGKTWNHIFGGLKSHNNLGDILTVNNAIVGTVYSIYMHVVWPETCIRFQSFYLNSLLGSWLYENVWKMCCMEESSWIILVKFSGSNCHKNHRNLSCIYEPKK